jgi:DNA (cytosine-5)-methyltransferase 1
VIERFSKLENGENIKNMLARLSVNDAKRLATKKQNCRKIVASEPSPTVLTLPDDLVHYSQNRILTVREMARLQSFDDSFEFLGKRTTGGDRRKLETPQYTLVGNAVPPLLAKAIAEEVMKNLILESNVESARKTAL